jgi:polysaccharide biosynthesis protein PslJ
VTAGGQDNWPHTKRALPWGLAGFLVMLWLLPFDSVSLPIPLPLEAKLDRPLLLLLITIWVLTLTRARRSPRLRASPVHYAFAAFILVAVLSLVQGADVTVRLGEFELGVRKLALLFSYVALFVGVSSSVRPGEVRPFMKLMCGLAALTAIGVLWEYRTGFNVFYEVTSKVLPVSWPAELGNVDSLGRKSIIGPTVHPLAPAMMMACAMPYALIRMYDDRELRRKILWGTVAGLMFAAALSTGRKTSLLAPLAAVVVLVAFRPRILRQLLPAAVGLFLIAHVAAPGALGSIGDALLPQNLFKTDSAMNRQSDYTAIRPDVIDHPFLGRGYETYDQKKYRILDNQYLTTMIGTGAIGVLAYFSIFLSIFLVAFRVARNRGGDGASIAIAIAATTVALALGSALFDLLAFPQIPYMLCFFAGFAVVLSWDLAPRSAAARTRDVVLPPRPVVPSAARVP